MKTGTVYFGQNFSREQLLDDDFRLQLLEDGIQKISDIKDLSMGKELPSLCAVNIEIHHEDARSKLEELLSGDGTENEIGRLSIDDPKKPTFRIANAIRKNVGHLLRSIASSFNLFPSSERSDSGAINQDFKRVTKDLDAAIEKTKGTLKQ